MPKPDYPSIKILSKIQEKHHFNFTLGERPMNWLCWVKVRSGNHEWQVLVYDEYHDLNPQNPLLCLYLVLYSLEDYADSEDYLEWSKENMIQPPQFMDHYRSLDTIYGEVKELLGEVESYISSIDYELRAGEYDALLNWST